ncbi:serine hydrolase [Methylacidimicrobium sp. B4]|uniref:serine hydrolase domain-containing protein n=1 Tax=Methylacidimicrobium sp. B4 TaxID=2796139 RepID=UPI001A90BDC9|nr:serine hydrolase domain-containing protein [Methylacidimicrobium sp. B4]QSR84226.1 beta-lactamase family protein [Methylacidimicrobium sp. B4]
MNARRAQTGACPSLHLLAALAIFGAGLVSPAAQGRPDREGLGFAGASAYSARHGGSALLVLEGGKVRWEEDGGGPPWDGRRRIFSGTKGFWILAALRAVQDGLFSLDTPVSETLVEWRNDPAKRRIRVRELLNFTSGLEPAFFLHADGLENRNARALFLPLLARPGQAFLYGPASLQVFHEFFRRRLSPRRETPTHFLESRVLSPMGLGRQRYLEDGSGNPLLATGFLLRARQWAAIGEVLLHHGMPLVEPAVLEEALRGSAVNPAFGMGFWNNRAASLPGAREVDVEAMLSRPWRSQDWRNACLWREGPTDLVAAIGSHGQRLYVIPSRGLIVVRQGFSDAFSDGAFLRLLFRGAYDAYPVTAAGSDSPDPSAR